VEITDTDHEPSHPALIRSDVRDILDWLYGEGRYESPIRKAAYLLWRTNAIHPFAGGNGRVARTLAYLVIIIEIAPIFAGESFPAKLKARKREYIEALKAADKGNLAILEQLVLECVQQQISESRRKRKKKRRARRMRNAR
jgi:Fic family protein